MTAQDDYQDAIIRHAIELEGLKAGLVKRVVTLLNKAEKDLIARIRLLEDELAIGPGNTVFASKQKLGRLTRLLSDLRDIRRDAWQRLGADLKDELKQLAVLEGAFNAEALREAIAIVEIGVTTPTAGLLQAVVTQRPIRGGLLRDWISKFARDDVRRVELAMRLGILEGDDIEGLIARVRGTRAAGFSDGALQVGRTEAALLARTTLNAVTNSAREVFFEENADLISGLKWAAVLDGRTTLICANRDGRVAPIGDKPLPEGVRPLIPPGARPPAHPNCRSQMVAWLDAVGMVGTRPFVTSTLGGRERRIHFRALARERAGSQWQGLSRRQRNALVAKARNGWLDEHVGFAPSETFYEDFMRRQSAAFQNEWLGKTKGALFRRGGLSLNEFVDEVGHEFTIEQLLAKHRSAFVAAGLL